VGLCAAERRTDLRGLTEHFAGQVRLTRQKLLACSLHTTVPHCARTVNLLQLLLPIAQLKAHLIILIKAIALYCVNDGSTLHGVLEVNIASDNVFLLIVGVQHR